MNYSKFIKIVSLVLVVCITALAGVFAANYVISQNGEGAHSGTEVVKGKRINLLLLATDKGGVLTDTIMFASFDKERNTLNIMSIPRDTRVSLGKSHANINSVYGAGKEGKRQELVIEKINEIIGMPVNYYAVINPAAFRNIIDILGGVEINSPENGAPHILNASFPGIRSEIILHTLEMHGVYVSSGSACNSNFKDKKSVLARMGFDKKIYDSAIRFSFSFENTEEEVKAAAEIVKREIELLRKRLRIKN